LGADTRNKNINLVLINARSIVNKMQDLEVYVEMEHPDIILITETWLKEDISSNEFQLDNYELLRKDRSQNVGGGCLIFYKKGLLVKEILPYGNLINNDPYIQLIWIELQSPINKTVIGLCYNSPNSSHEEKLELSSQIKEICSNHKDVLLCGDFNFPNINWKTLHANGDAKVFLDTTMDCFLHQHIYIPTRNNNILDLVLSTEGVEVTNIAIESPLGTSDHNTVKFSIPATSVDQNWKTSYYDYRSGQYKKFSKYLKEINWDTLFMEKNAEQMLESITNILEVGTKKFIPIRQRSNNRKQPIWFNRKLLRLSKRKQSLWKRFRKTNLERDYITYKASLNLLNKSIRREKWKTENKIAKNIKKDPKAFFKYVKSKLSNKTQVQSLELPDGKAATTDNEIVNILNKYFASVFSEEQNIIETHIQDQHSNDSQEIIIDEKMVKKTP
jgi:hypothetical protein